MDKEIHNDEDVFDSRDVLDYIKNNKDDRDFALESIVKQFCDNYDDGMKRLEFGVTFIRDSYFEDYMWDYFLEFNQVDEALQCYIDIEGFARDQQHDYESVNFDGVTYWYRSV